jgi:hypothetical protein
MIHKPLVLIRGSGSVSNVTDPYTVIVFEPLEPVCSCHFILPSYVLFCVGMDEEEGDMPDVGDLAHEDDEDKHVRFTPGGCGSANAEPDPDQFFHVNADLDPHFYLKSDPDPFLFKCGSGSGFSL